RNDAAAFGQMGYRGLRRNERCADIDVHHRLELREFDLRYRPGEPDRCTIDQDVEAAQRCDDLVDGPFDGLRIGAVGLDGKCTATQLPYRSDDAVRALGRVLVRDRDIRAAFGQSLRDRGTDTPGPARYESALAFEINHGSSVLTMAVGVRMREWPL